MKLLFCHDGPIEKTSDNNYYGIGFNDELFDRYKIIADDISVAMRVNNIDKNNFDSSKYLRLSSNYTVIPCPNVSSIKGQLLNKNKCKKILEEKIKENDLIIIRLPSFIGNIAVDIAKRNKKPYLIELVGCPWDALWNHSLKGKLMAPYMFFKTKYNVKKAKYVIYVTNEFLQKRYPTKGESIGCSDVKIETIEEFKPQNIDLNNKKIILGTIGVLDVKYKGQEYVIKAIYHLKKMGYDIEYQLVGQGTGERLKKIAIKYKVLDNIRFVGVLQHDQIFDWLKNINIYIQPSTTEGMPRALIEAMSQGCFCIGSNVGGIPELLDKRFIFKKRKYREIYKIIMSLSSDDYEKQTIGNYNVAKYFSKKILEERRCSFYGKYKKEVVIDE